jgi:hypothetical protein
MIWKGMAPRERGLRGLVVVSGLVVFGLSSNFPAAAQPSEARIKEITDQLRAMQAEQQEQARQLKAQQDLYAKMQAAQQAGPGATGLSATNPATPGPESPVGEAPVRSQEPPQVVQSLPQGLAVLTPQGRFTVMPSLEYTQTTSDRLVFLGVVIVPGINLGEVTASTDDRSIVTAAADVRYGITERLEIEARIPFTFADDRATVLVQAPQGSATQSLYVSNMGMGDMEFGARYQINHGADDWPIFVANSRFKMDTGSGPFDIRRNIAGIAEEVPLGSGFMGIEGGFSVLKLSDHAVLYGSMNLIYQIPKDINQTIGGVLVGRVEPSSSIGMTMGMGFAVNPDLSFSLGYEHNHVFPQYTELGTTRQHTTSLEVGAMTMGMAYRLGPRTSLNANFEFGITAAAPDVRVVFSLPITFG